MAAALAPVPVLADHAGVIVIPAVPGVPVVINGRDASYAVVEGDWGLYRPGAIEPVVTYGYNRAYAPGVAPYYPSAGHRPGYGRLEIEPPAHRRLPQRAEHFERNWAAGSDMTPPQAEPPMQPPAVIYAPREGGEPYPQPRRR